MFPFWKHALIETEYQKIEKNAKLRAKPIGTMEERKRECCLMGCGVFEVAGQVKDAPCPNTTNDVHKD